MLKLSLLLFGLLLAFARSVEPIIDLNVQQNGLEKKVSSSDVGIAQPQRHLRVRNLKGSIDDGVNVDGGGEGPKECSKGDPQPAPKCEYSPKSKSTQKSKPSSKSPPVMTKEKKCTEALTCMPTPHSTLSPTNSPVTIQSTILQPYVTTEPPTESPVLVRTSSPTILRPTNSPVAILESPTLSPVAPTESPTFSVLTPFPTIISITTEAPTSTPTCNPIIEVFKKLIQQTKFVSNESTRITNGVVNNNNFNINMFVTEDT